MGERTSIRRRQVNVGLNEENVEKFIASLRNPLMSGSEKIHGFFSLFDPLLNAHKIFFASLIAEAAKGGEEAKKAARHNIIEGYEILFILCLRFDAPTIYEEMAKRLIGIPALNGGRFNYNDALSSIANPIRYLRAILSAFTDNNVTIFDFLHDGVQKTQRSSAGTLVDTKVSMDHAAYVRAFMRKLERTLHEGDPGIKKIRGMRVRPEEYAVASQQCGSLQEATITTSFVMTAQEMAIVQKAIVDRFSPGMSFAEGVKLFLVNWSKQR